MASYPVEAADTSGMVDAVNNLLSGPGGLGQDFSGFASFEQAYLTGNFRTPYTKLAPFNSTTNVIPRLYVALIPLSTSQMLSGNTWQFTFATAQAEPPFVIGQGITVSDVVDGTQEPSEFTFTGTKSVLGSETTYPGIFPTTLTGSGTGLELNITLLASGAVAYTISNTTIEIEEGGTGYIVGDTVKVLGTALGGTTPANDLTLTVLHTSGYYDNTFNPIGVVSCSTTQVIARTQGSFAIVAPGSGGDCSYEFTSQGESGGSGYDISTDCNSKVVVTGGTDRVFVAGQLNNTISYTATTLSDLYYTVKISRYRGQPNTNLVNPGFVFLPDETVASIEYEFLALNGTGTLPVVDTVFSTLVDADIAPGYYWYILDVNFFNTTGDLQVTTCELAQRSFTAQVVKQ